MIKARNIEHYFGKDRVLKNINLHIEKDSFTIITGESGSGKTTLLSILSTLLTPTKGEARIKGVLIKDIKNIDKFRRDNIGFVFQFHYLIPHLKIFENIVINANNKNPKRAFEIAKRLGIENLMDRYPHEISGGERQRAAIVRALINSPKILFADEPTGNLDSKSAENVFSLLRELDITVIAVTHNRSLISSSDRVIQMKDGRIC